MPLIRSTLAAPVDRAATVKGRGSLTASPAKTWAARAKITHVGGEGL